MSGNGSKGVRRVEKPWGHELIWAETGRYVGKVLHIRAGERLSFQYHRVKDETIFIQAGRMLLVVEDGDGRREIEMDAGERFHITPGLRHRMVALSDCDVFEVSTPELDDVVRLEDAYGREGTKEP